MKALSDSSLIFWFICYIAGIISALSPYWLWILGLVCCMFYSVFFLVRLFPNLRFYVLLAPLFFLLGSWSMESVFPQQNHALTQGENYYLGRIEHVASNNKLWNTNMVRLCGIRNGEQGWETSSERVLLLIENDRIEKEQFFRQHDVLLFKTTFREIDILNNPGEFDAKTYWYSKGVRYQGFGVAKQVVLIERGEIGWFETLLTTVRQYSAHMLDTWIGLKDAPLLKALLLGDKSDLDTETKRIFMNTGAMHMLAVSGMHVGLIVVVMELFFKFLLLYRGKNISSWIMVVMLWFYAFLTGFSASVTRAVIMFTVLILSGFLRRGYQAINSLCIAAFVILVINPMALFDIGFQLSFLAMLGIFTVYSQLQNLFVSRYELINKIWQGTAVGLAAQVFTLPLSLYYFHQFPNYFMLTNIGVMLFSGILLGLSIALLLVGKVPLLSIPIGWVVALCASVFIGFIALVETLPGAIAVGFSPNIIWIFAAYCMIFVALYWWEKGKWLRVFCILLPFLTWLQLERLENVSQKEWVVFNSRQTIILFNNAGQQICLYEDTPKNRKQAHKIVEDYQKIHPGISEFYPITAKKTTVKVGKEKFHITCDKKFTQIDALPQQYVFVSSAYVDQILSNTNLIQRVNRKPSTTKYVHVLETGAYRVAF